MFCMLMHLLHGNHAGHASEGSAAQNRVTSPEIEIAELRGEVRVLREMLGEVTLGTPAAKRVIASEQPAVGSADGQP